jgi:DNA polymerase-1
MILIIDGSGITFRAWAKMPALSNYRGYRTEVIYNFISVLRKYVKQYKPKFVIAVWEGKNPKRVSDNNEYKRKRREKREEQKEEYKIYFEQINELKKWLPKLGVNCVSIDGYEADDVIVCLAKKYKSDAVIVAYDSDLIYVCKYGAKYINPESGEIKELRRKGFLVKAEDIFLYKAVVGDPSDEVAGVKGLGDSFWKSVQKELDGLSYKEKLVTLKDKIRRKKGEEGVKQFIESYRLVRLPYNKDYNIIDGIELSEFKCKKENIVEFMYEYDINSIKVEDFLC